MDDSAGSILLDGQSFSLSDLANLGWDEIQAVKSTRLPSGSYAFRVDDTKLESKEITIDGEKAKVLGILIKLDVVKCFGATAEPNEPEIDPDSMVGKTHMETFFIRTTEQYGRFKQFLMDTGYEPTPENRTSFQMVLQGFKDHQFKTMIKRTTNKNDPEAEKFVNMRQDKVKPYFPDDAA